MGEVILWCGEPVNEMSRDQLVEIISEMGRTIEADRKNHRHEMDMLFDLVRQRA